jgi:hypothetical protein
MRALFKTEFEIIKSDALHKRRSIVIELRSTSDDLKPAQKKMLVFLIIYYLYRNTLANS